MKIFEFFDGKFNLSISGVSFLIFSVLAIAAVGYLLGKVTIKGVNLGTAGVFLIALLFGCLFYGDLGDQTPLYTTNALKIVESMGLMPNFMDKFQMNGIDLPKSFFANSRGNF